MSSFGISSVDEAPLSDGAQSVLLDRQGRRRYSSALPSVSSGKKNIKRCARLTVLDKMMLLAANGDDGNMCGSLSDCHAAHEEKEKARAYVRKMMATRFNSAPPNLGVHPTSQSKDEPTIISVNDAVSADNQNTTKGCLTKSLNGTVSSPQASLHCQTSFMIPPGAEYYDLTVDDDVPKSTAGHEKGNDKPADNDKNRKFSGSTASYNTRCHSVTPESADPDSSETELTEHFSPLPVHADQDDSQMRAEYAAHVLKEVVALIEEGRVQFNIQPIDAHGTGTTTPAGYQRVNEVQLGLDEAYSHQQHLHKLRNYIFGLKLVNHGHGHLEPTPSPEPQVRRVPEREVSSCSGVSQWDHKDCDSPIASIEEGDRENIVDKQAGAKETTQINQTEPQYRQSTPYPNPKPKTEEDSSDDELSDDDYCKKHFADISEWEESPEDESAASRIKQAVDSFIRGLSEKEKQVAAMMVSESGSTQVGADDARLHHDLVELFLEGIPKEERQDYFEALWKEFRGLPVPEFNKDTVTGQVATQESINQQEWDLDAAIADAYSFTDTFSPLDQSLAADWVTNRTCGGSREAAELRNHVEKFIAEKPKNHHESYREILAGIFDDFATARKNSQAKVQKTSKPGKEEVQEINEEDGIPEPVIDMSSMDPDLLQELFDEVVEFLNKMSRKKVRLAAEVHVFKKRKTTKQEDMSDEIANFIMRLPGWDRQEMLGLLLHKGLKRLLDPEAPGPASATTEASDLADNTDPKPVSSTVLESTPAAVPQASQKSLPATEAAGNASSVLGKRARSSDDGEQAQPELHPDSQDVTNPQAAARPTKRLREGDPSSTPSTEREIKDAKVATASSTAYIKTTQGRATEEEKATNIVEPSSNPEAIEPSIKPENPPSSPPTADIKPTTTVEPTPTPSGTKSTSNLGKRNRSDADEGSADMQKDSKISARKTKKARTKTYVPATSTMPSGAFALAPLASLKVEATMPATPPVPAATFGAPAFGSTGFTYSPITAPQYDFKPSDETFSDFRKKRGGEDDSEEEL